MNKLKLSLNINKSDWATFVYEHPKGNIFQTPEMYDVYMSTNNHEPILLVVVDEKDEIQGILLAVVQKQNLGFLSIFSSRLVIDGGPLIKYDNEDVLNFILAELKKVIKNRVIYILFRNYWKWSKETVVVFKENNFQYDEQLDIIINLNQDIDEIMGHFNKNLKRNITKSINKGVTFHEIKKFDDYVKSLSLIKDTYKRIEIPFPEINLFINSFHILHPKSFLRAFVCMSKNKIIGVRLELIFKESMFDWYAGHDITENNKYPNDFLINNILNWGKDNNINKFDFGGAGKKNIPYSVRDYKMKFGGKLVEFGRFYLENRPVLYKISKIGLIIYKRLIRYGLRK